MNGKLIIIEGYLASGKSSFARRLSKVLNIPYFVKDTFKIALGANLSIDYQTEGRRFSAVTFNAMMYAAERMMETGVPFIIEGNFVPAGVKPVDEAGVIKALTEKYDCKPLTFKFTGDTRVLHRRYVERNDSPERGDANRFYDETPYDVFERYCRNLDAFGVGGDVIGVDTTDFSAVDYGYLIEQARFFMGFA
jgi:predicted kinase